MPVVINKINDPLSNTMELSKKSNILNYIEHTKMANINIQQVLSTQQFKFEFVTLSLHKNKPNTTQQFEKSKYTNGLILFYPLNANSK